MPNMNLNSKLRHLRLVTTDGRWLPFYFQRQFMRSSTRARLSSWIARRLRPALPFAWTGAPSSARVAEQVAELRSAGISHLGELLPGSQAQVLFDYFRQRLVRDQYRSFTHAYLPDSDEHDPLSHTAHHAPRDIVMAPGLLALANRPDILEVVSPLLGCKPTLGYLAAWWSYPTALGAQQAEHFHRDVDDWRFVKLFVYLTEVGQHNGPHVYVKYSAVHGALRDIRRLTDEEVLQAFGAENVIRITGRAGEGFLEDTFGVHKGQPVSQGKRLIFQAVYSMFPLPYGPKGTVASQDEVESLCGQIDPWINRLYVSTQ